MNAPAKVVVKNARGESFADVARRIGSIGDVAIPPTYSDAEVLAALSSNFAEIVAAAGYTVIAAVETATSALNGDGNITLSGEQTIGGVLTSTSRVLLTDQTAPAENGIWVTSAGAWVRAIDFDQTAEVMQGSYVLVTGGDNAGAWVLVTSDPITVGTTAQTWRVWGLNQTLKLIADLASTASGKGSELIGYKSAASGAVARTVDAKLQELPSVFDFMTTAQIADVQAGSAAVDVVTAIQAALDADIGPIRFPAGVYAVSDELVIPDGSGIIGHSAFWKRRTGYVYDPSQQTVFKYIGAGGTNSCVVRLSEKAVGAVGSDFTAPGTDDLINVVARDFHVDANSLAEIGCYVYRAGNQATIGNITAEKAKKRNLMMLGCYAADYGTFGAYECEEHGVEIGWDYFGWGSVEATNFDFEARFLLANNGTAGTYVAGTGTDLDGSGGRFSIGRGSKVYITSESNDGRACLLSQYNSANSTMGPTEYVIGYLEGNADGPYIDYRDAMDGLILSTGFLHPGNGSSLLPQNIKIDGKNNSGVTTADSGPSRTEEWLTLYRLSGDLSGVGVEINSNTFKYKMIECGPYFTYTTKRPGAYAFSLALEGAAVAGSQTYTLRSGWAQRHGNVVTVTGRITLSALDGATSGAIRITNLPYRVANLANYHGMASSIAFNALNTNVLHLVGMLAAGNTRIDLKKITAAGTSNITDLSSADLTNTTLLQFTATYITDD